MAGSAFSEDVLSINAVGDILMGTLYPEKRLPPEDGASIFKFVKEYLTNGNPDIVMGNLEGSITHYKYTHKDVSTGRYWAFRMPPEYVKYLKEANFTVMAMANNHAYDFGEIGYQETRDLLDSVGIKYVGKKREVLQLEIKGKKVAVIAFSYFDTSNNHLRIEESMQWIREVKASNDIIVLTFHGGAEGDKALHVPYGMEYHWGEKRGRLREFCRKAIDNGADIVIGHGPHVVRGMELYKGRLIAYSLGNFATYSMGTKGHVKYTLILHAEMGLSGNFVRGKIIPLMQFDEGELRGIPYYDAKCNTVKLIQKLSREDFKDSKLIIKDDGTLEPPYVERIGEEF